MKEVIQKAIEGGYKFREYDLVEDNSRFFRPDGDGAFLQALPEQIWCDPLFWQCLGKSFGWGETMFPVEFKREDGSTEYLYWKGDNNHQYTPHLVGWKYYWIEFIHHLASGKDAEEFFKDLIN